MKFTKGIILGSLLTAGAMMMYSEGIDTNRDFLYQILENENFVKNKYDTSFIKKEFNM